MIVSEQPWYWNFYSMNRSVISRTDNSVGIGNVEHWTLWIPFNGSRNSLHSKGSFHNSSVPLCSWARFTKKPTAFFQDIPLYSSTWFNSNLPSGLCGGRKTSMLLSFVLSRSWLSFILGMEVRPIYTRGLLLSQHGESTTEKHLPPWLGLLLARLWLTLAHLDLSSISVLASKEGKEFN